VVRGAAAGTSVVLAPTIVVNATLASARPTSVVLTTTVVLDATLAR
jgi:hypothetical protein